MSEVMLPELKGFRLLCFEVTRIFACFQLRGKLGKGGTRYHQIVGDGGFHHAQYIHKDVSMA